MSPTIDWLTRGLGISAVLLAASLTVLAGRGARWQQLRRWRYLAGFSAGVAWWLWLWPSVFGLLLALLSVVAGARTFVRPPRKAESAVATLSVSSRH
jgi:hypothetical protein